MAKLHTRHTIALSAKVSYSHGHTLFGHSSIWRFSTTKVAHVAPRSPRCSGTFQFFFLQMCKSAFCKLYLSKVANVFLQIAQCEKQEMTEMCWEVSSWSVYSERAAAFYSGIRVQALETRDSFAPLLLCSLCSLCSSEFKDWAISPSFLPCSPGFLGFSVLSPRCMEGATEWSVRSTDISGLIVVIDQDGARWYGVCTAWVKGEAKDTFPGFPRRLWEATVWPEWKNQRGLGTSQVDSWNPLHSWHGHLLFYNR